MTVAGARRLVVVVDADPAFVEDARLLLQRERVLAARTTDEAAEIVAGGRVDLVLLGPTFGNEASVLEASLLRQADPQVVVVLAANIVTNRILLAAMRSGVADVLETPLTARRLDETLGRAGNPKAPTPPPVEATGPVAAVEGVPAEPPVVTIEFEAESGSATRASFVPAESTPMRSMVPPSGPINEPDAPADAPEPRAWRVATPEVPAPIAVSPAPEPTPAVAQPVAVVPPPVVVAVAAPEPVAAPPTAEPPAPPSFPPMASHDSEPARVIAPMDAPPPPTTPPPLPSSNTVVRPTPVPSGPVDLEAMGVLPADGPRRAPRSGSGKVVAVMAGKGGSGKTITATNLAMALTFQRGEDTVAILDADIQFGDVALMLQLDPGRTLADAVGRIDELTDARLDGMLLRHESGLRVMPAPLLPTSEEAIPAKGVVEVIERLSGMYQYVVVDTPPIFDDHLITVLECADEVLAVVDMDLPSVKNAKIALDTLRSSRFPMERVRLVVNRVNAKARLDLVELERSLGLRVAGSIPSDRLVPQSVNEGIPVVALSPRSRVARSFHALAQMLMAAEGSGHRR